MKAVFKKIQENQAIIELENNQEIFVSKDYLPNDISPGDNFTIYFKPEKDSSDKQAKEILSEILNTDE